MLKLIDVREITAAAYKAVKAVVRESSFMFPEFKIAFRLRGF
jgi:hypothetical protein